MDKPKEEMIACGNCGKRIRFKIQEHEMLLTLPRYDSPVKINGCVAVCKGCLHHFNNITEEYNKALAEEEYKKGNIYCGTDNTDSRNDAQPVRHGD